MKITSIFIEIQPFPCQWNIWNINLFLFYQDRGYEQSSLEKISILPSVSDYCFPGDTDMRRKGATSFL